ncbi:hypothetical protein [Pseudomonas umsongensis]|uniref:Uncharacterized protein n=1 Tax=Pseudomonas umsongensis TaxID=198618 RepID=A0AAE7DDF3_9PSED|nr:hypothetical protein [Pseudomonas umsongensis]QJC78221.1 hypothetical protein HGP31_07825 [Pseudomonas umsongensis]
MSKSNIFDFTAPAVARIKNAARAHGVVRLPADSPLSAPLDADEDLLLMDEQWLFSVIERIPERNQIALVEFLKNRAFDMHGVVTADTLLATVYSFFKYMESEGRLHEVYQEGTYYE